MNLEMDCVRVVGSSKSCFTYDLEASFISNAAIQAQSVSAILHVYPVLGRESRAQRDGRRSGQREADRVVAARWARHVRTRR